jgi:hypothetical protein
MTREQLIALADGYFAALPAGDPAVLPLAADVRFTENGEELALGSGAWETVTAIGAPPSVRVADPQAGQVLAWALVDEGAPSILGVRLGVRDGEIAEIETLLCRPRRRMEGGLLWAPGLQTSRAVLDEPVEPARRSSREELEAAAHGYLDAVVGSDSRLLRVRDDCRRIENGALTVLNDGGEDLPPGRAEEPYWRMGVAEQIDTGIFRDIGGANDRRVLAIDEERGLVTLAFRFDHPGPTEANGFESRYTEPNGMTIMEVWKVVDGEIVHVESILDVFEYGRPMGW